MKQPMYKCPKCGNTALVFAVDTIVQRTYKVRLDGEPYKRQFDTTEYDDRGSERIECPHCNSDVHMSDGHELKKWKNSEYNPAKKKR